MLLIRELGRVLRDLLAFFLFERKFGLLLVVVVVVVVIFLAATVTTVGPVLVYPLI